MTASVTVARVFRMEDSKRDWQDTSSEFSAFLYPILCFSMWAFDINLVIEFCRNPLFLLTCTEQSETHNLSVCLVTQKRYYCFKSLSFFNFLNFKSIKTCLIQQINLLNHLTSRVSLSLPLVWGLAHMTKPP